jgi:hypothetical protein
MQNSPTGKRLLGGAGGMLIGTELEATKATTARGNLAAASLDNLVDIRVLDALATLNDGIDGMSTWSTSTGQRINGRNSIVGTA